MTDTSPKRLRELAANIQNYYSAAATLPVVYYSAAATLPVVYYSAAATLPVVRTLLALADEKESKSEVDEMDVVASEFAHRLAMNLECLILECPASSRFYEESLATLGAYRSAMNAIHERLSPTHMGDPVFSEKEAQQRDRMKARFAIRATSPPTADFDLPHQSDDVSDHTEQPLAMVPDVPLPEPDNASMYPYTIDQMHQYGQACAKSARDATFDECIAAVNECHNWQHINSQEHPNWWHEGVEAAIDELEAVKKGTP